MKTTVRLLYVIVALGCTLAYVSQSVAHPAPVDDASQAKEQIYVFFYKVYPEQVNASLAIVRSKSFDDAQDLTNDTHRPSWFVTKRIDEDRCRSGFFIFGANNGKGEGSGIAGTQVTSAFLNCGYATLDEAIQKGTRDFPIPFFQIVVGSVSAKDGAALQLVCGYRSQTGQWTNEAGFGESGWSYKTAGCERLNSAYPILVDRQPEQSIWVTPR